MKLTRDTLKNISPENMLVPDEEIFDFPEKVLQFGTGMLLRALPDYFIDKANRNGIFNGRIVMVKSTSKGDTAAFAEQDYLYTLCERGIINGKKVEENRIISSVSRVLVANNQWNEILECAHNENLKIIISNTTEIGIQYQEDNIHTPVSYPGKLLAFLCERFNAFHGSKESGFVIIPTELIPDNGKELKSIILKLAHLNSLEIKFIEWVENCNYFCNSLVDRIVTGMPDEKIKLEIENELGYQDDLLIVSELYSLWAIEGNEKIKNILSFAKADESVIIEPDIDLYRELKLRLLNGTHTLCCGVAFFSGFETVLQSMENEIFFSFITKLMKEEISPSIPFEINEETKQQFISKVIDRFSDPYIHHLWKNITLNYTLKMRMRCIPLLLNYYKHYRSVPPLCALGFAAYLYFMKAVQQNGKDFYGEFNSEYYLIEDEMAEKFYDLWNEKPVDGIVTEVLKNECLWQYDLTSLPGFAETVTNNLNSIITNGMKETLKKSHS